MGESKLVYDDETTLCASEVRRAREADTAKSPQPDVDDPGMSAPVHAGVIRPRKQVRNV